jgi:hypothetical protein
MKKIFFFVHPSCPSCLRGQFFARAARRGPSVRDGEDTVYAGPSSYQEEVLACLFSAHPSQR